MEQKKILKREHYLSELLKWRNLPFIKILTGVRGCGKSTLLRLFAQNLLEKGIHPDQIIEINLEDVAYESLRDYRELHQFIIERTDTSRNYYIFLDEIQQVDNFQKVVASLLLRKNFDIYITSSNAGILEGEQATFLAGRYVQIKMLPLTLQEFRQIFPEKSPDDLFRQFLSSTSFPFISQVSPDSKLVDKLLDGLFNTVIVKDIMDRVPIRDSRVLFKLIRLCFETSSHRVSVAKLANSLTSADNKTVERYLRTLVGAFVLYEVARWDIKHNEPLCRIKKYYSVDLGLRRILLSKPSKTDIDSLLENVIFLELLRRGYTVYTGKLDDMEVDFVCTRSQQKVYIQVAASVREEQVLSRELKPLLRIKGNHPKLLLTLDNDPEKSIEGIQKLNVLNWLLKNG